jgi:hypothetical protein
MASRAYRGAERRHHQVFVTRNSEYHCRDDLCVAVRDLATGEFQPQHSAIGKRMTGGIRFDEDGRVVSFSRRGEEPHLGENLIFSDGSFDRELRTSAFRRVTRPEKAVVEQYQPGN